MNSNGPSGNCCKVPNKNLIGHVLGGKNGGSRAYLESVPLKLCHKPLYLSLPAHDSHATASMCARLTHQGPYCWGFAYPYYSMASLFESSHTSSHSARVVPQVAPHESTKPLHVSRSLHVVTPTCLCCCPCVLATCTPFQGVYLICCTLNYS